MRGRRHTLAVSSRCPFCFGGFVFPDGSWAVARSFGRPRRASPTFNMNLRGLGPAPNYSRTAVLSCPCGSNHGYECTKSPYGDYIHSVRRDTLCLRCREFIRTGREVRAEARIAEDFIQRVLAPMLLHSSQHRQQVFLRGLRHYQVRAADDDAPILLRGFDA